MITSSANPKIKQVKQLQQQSKERRESGLYVVEGFKMLEEVPLDDLVAIYATESCLRAIEAMNYQRIPVEIVSDSVMKELSSVVTPQGILAVVKQQKNDLASLKIQDQSLLVLLENIQDPGNLGTIIRTAEAVNATGLILTSGCVEVYNPKVVRATMGSLLRLPIVSDVSGPEAVNWLKKHGVHVVAAHLKGEKNYYELNYKESTCFLIGNEGNGLSEELSALASTFIRIPMPGRAESLNASIATGVLLYEVLRQRS